MRKCIQLVGLVLVTALAAAAADKTAPPDMPRYKWENFTVADGLPNNRVYAVAVDADRVWVGTDNGLALYENGKFKVFGMADGLPQQACLSVALNKKTHELWIATMGGAARYSGGRIDAFTQLTSGLANDVVYKVAPYGDEVWFATAAGASRLNTKTNQWSIYNERNTTMNEIWTYAVSPGEDKVYYAVWGAGLLEYTRATDRWKSYDDPDGETEIVLYKNQGLIHEITTTVSYVNKVVWVGTYFGVSRYDGRNWQNFLNKDSGLPSNFMNEVKSIDGDRTWFSTDKGLAYYDGANWAVYRPALDTKQPEMIVRDAQGQTWNIPVTTAPAHNYIFAVDFQGDDIWVATAKGLSHGIRIKEIAKK